MERLDGKARWKGLMERLDGKADVSGWVRLREG
jgi:hypothetical protein